MVEKSFLIKELNYFLKIHIKMKIPRWVLSKSLNLKDKDFFSCMKVEKVGEQHKGETRMVSNSLRQ